MNSINRGPLFQDTLFRDSLSATTRATDRDRPLPTRGAGRGQDFSFGRWPFLFRSNPVGHSRVFGHRPCARYIGIFISSYGTRRENSSVRMSYSIRSQPQHCGPFHNNYTHPIIHNSITGKLLFVSYNLSL